MTYFVTVSLTFVSQTQYLTSRPIYTRPVLTSDHQAPTSKAFDLVDHHILFSKLQERGLPAPILCFLLGWYKFQQMRVRWNSFMSDSFSVSNGVRLGSMLSPVLFAVYLDGLLSELEGSGVGCYWGAHFMGTVCYADDIALLAPCPSAMRTMLSVCEEYAVTHGLKFNPDKTQLICFRSQSTFMYHDRISLDGVDLKYSHASRSFAFLQSGRHTGHHQGDQRPESKGKFCSVYF